MLYSCFLNEYMEKSIKIERRKGKRSSKRLKYPVKSLKGSRPTHSKEAGQKGCVHCTSISCLRVLSQAPSLVIAKAVEILRGDRKMLSL